MTRVAFRTGKEVSFMVDKKKDKGKKKDSILKKKEDRQRDKGK